jgi:hypothetical protein
VIKFTDARQVRDAYRYINFKENIHKTSAAVWLSKMCRTYHLKPRIINIPIKGTAKRCQKALEIAVNFRIYQELRFFISKNRDLINNYEKPI